MAILINRGMQYDKVPLFFYSTHYTEVHFASLLSGGFTTMTVLNPQESKLAKCTSVYFIKGTLY